MLFTFWPCFSLSADVCSLAHRRSDGAKMELWRHFWMLSETPSPRGGVKMMYSIRVAD